MKRLQRQLVLLTTVLLTIAAIFVSVRAGRNFESSLTEQALTAEREIGRSAIDAIQKALQHGVPFEGLVDADRYLETVKRDNRRVEYLIVTSMDGLPRYRTDIGTIDDNTALLGSIATHRGEATARIGKYFNSSMPINHNGSVVGYLHLGQRANIVGQLLLEIAFDILTILVVASLVAFELVRVLMAASFSSPLQAVKEFLAGISAGDFRRYMPRDIFGGIGRLDRRLNAAVADINSRARRVAKTAAAPLPQGFGFDTRDERAALRVSSIESIRWPFFLLIFAESLSLAFFPNFVAQFYDPSYGIPRNLVIGIPITVFMLVWAIIMPFAGTWCDRVGYRKAFSVGAAATTVGLTLTAYSTSVVDLLLWRSITAVGYGIVYVTAQAFITTHTSPSERIRGQSMFLASFFAGSLSGAAIGGILVDRLGFQMTFLFSAGLSALTAAYVLRFLRAEVGRTTAKKRLALTDFKLLLQHKQFAAIALFSAIPAKIALAGFLYYSVPLYLKALGYNQSVTGRVMMAYGLAIILVSPVVAQLADRVKNHSRFLMLGGLIAATAVAIPLFVEDMKGAALAVVCLGIGHAIGVSPQMALIIDRCGETVAEIGQAKSVGIFRLVERVGTITGPILLGLMIAFADFMGTFIILAAFTFATTTIFALLLLWFDHGAAKAQAA